MRGLAQDFTPGYGDPVPFTRQVVAVVCASSFPEPALIAETLRKGQAHDPHTLWVVRDKDRLAVAALEELGVEYLPIPLHPYWKVVQPVYGPLEKGKRTLPAHTLHDGRATVRNCELIACSSMVVVFASPEPGSLSLFFDAAERDPKIKLIVRGKPKVRERRGRKPVGA